MKKLSHYCAILMTVISFSGHTVHAAGVATLSVEMKSSGKKNITSSCTLHLVAGSGVPGSITVRNTSEVTAYDIFAFDPTHSLDDISQDASGCESLAPHGTCTLLIYPGSHAHAATEIFIVGSNTNAVSLTLIVSSPKMGAPWQGGIVYKTSGNTVYTVAQVDSGSLPWDPSVVPVSISAAQSLSDGAANTQHIYNRLTGVHGYPSDSYAAGVCRDYSIDAFGNSPCVRGDCYTDWYLPSLNELTEWLKAADAVGPNAFYLNSTPNAYYWTSNNNEAWANAFSPRIAKPYDKMTPLNVRCFRVAT